MPWPGGGSPPGRPRPQTRSACPQNPTAREAPGDPQPRAVRLTPGDLGGSTTLESRRGLETESILVCRWPSDSPGFSGCTWDVAGAWRVSTWAVQILQLAGGERRMAPDGLGGAALEGACDVHPVGGFEEDDLGSQRVAVEPAAGGGDRDGFAIAVHGGGHGPGPGTSREGQRVGGLDEADLPAAGRRRHFDRGEGRLDMDAYGAGGRRLA